MTGYGVSNIALDLIGAGLGETTAAGVGDAYFAALGRFGARAIFSRDISNGVTTILSRHSPAGWEDIYAEQQFAGVNYLTRELAQRSSAFAWSDVPVLNRRERQLWNAVMDFGVRDGLAIPFHSRSSAGVTSLAFDRLHDLSPDERQAIEMAGLVLHDRMRRFAVPQAGKLTILSPRERDCVAMMAAGRRDAEIATALSISHATVITYMNSAKRKLDARTRAQMVAIALMQGLL